MRGLAAFCALTCISAAQTKWDPDEVRSTNHIYELPSPVTLSVQSNLVEVGVVVRDAHGRVVGGLQQSDFRILDDGKERAITMFSVETSKVNSSGARTEPTPARSPTQSPQRSVVLFFDDLSTPSGDLTHARLAARRFVTEALNPGDRVAVVTSSSTQFLDFTADAQKIQDTIAKVSSHQRVSENGISRCPRITPYQAYWIVNHDTTAEKAGIDEEYVCENGPPAPVSLSAS